MSNSDEDELNHEALLADTPPAPATRERKCECPHSDEEANGRSRGDSENDDMPAYDEGPFDDDDHDDLHASFRRLIAGKRLSESGCAPEAMPSRVRRTAEQIYEAMRNDGVLGSESVLRHFSLIGDWRYRTYGPRTRILLAAPSSAGKSYLLRRFAAALQMPFVHLDAACIAEPGWQGLQVADVLTQAWRAAGSNTERLERDGAVILLDEICKSTIRRRTNGSEADVHGSAVKQARQAAILNLVWGESPCRFPASAEGGIQPMSLSVSTEKFIIVGAGAFADASWLLGDRPISDLDLQEWGFIPELASRFTTRLRLQPRGIADLVELLANSEDAVPACETTARAFGYDLTIAREAVALVASAIACGGGGLTFRTGAGILVSATINAINAALACELQQNAELVVAPDDVIGLIPRA
jgi:hypothetical protein